MEKSLKEKGGELRKRRDQKRGRKLRLLLRIYDGVSPYKAKTATRIPTKKKKKRGREKERGK